MAATDIDGDLSDLVHRLRRGEATPLEVVEGAIERAGEGRAFVAIEAERALEQARRLTALRPAERGPLAGAPYARKDMIGRAGFVLGAGSPIRAHEHARVTAPVLERLDRAGGIDLGRLNMAEFALSPTGFNAQTPPPDNPWNPAYPTGGSSSGSGVAVARGLVGFALGSDTGGSIRHPCGMCGITGIKPTGGLVSMEGCFPLAWSLDCLGPMARSARDCALLLPIMVGARPKDWAEPSPAMWQGDLSGVRIARPEGYYAEGLDPEVAAALDEAAAVLRRCGAEIVSTRAPDMETIHRMAAIVFAVEAASILSPYIEAQGDRVGWQIRHRVAPGRSYAATDYAEALRSRSVLAETWTSAVVDQADAALLPLFPAPIPPIAETVGSPEIVDRTIAGVTRFTRAFNYLGLPALSMPTGSDANGLPLAAQLVGRPNTDLRLVAIADAFQRASAHHLRRPPA